MHNSNEVTLALLKPDALQRDLVGPVISRFERKGLQLVGLRMFQFTEPLVREHYAHVIEQPFFQELLEFMTSGPSVAVAIAGPGAVETVREMIGTTRGHLASQGTIRGDFAMSAQRNVVHASDSADSALVEIRRFFAPQDVFFYADKLFDSVYGGSDIF